MNKKESIEENNTAMVFNKTQYVEKELIDIVTLWMLRTIVKAGGFNEFLNGHHGFSDDHVAYFLDMGAYVENEDSFSRKEIYRHLSEKLRRMEQREHFSSLSSLERNLDRLAKLVGLDKTERSIMKIAAVSKNYKIFNTVLEYLGRDLTTKQAKEALATILNVDFSKINKALSPKSALISSSLINLQSDRWVTCDLGDKLELPTERFTEFMFYAEEEDIIVALKDSIGKVSDGVLKLKDYDHMEEDVLFLHDYLKASFQQKKAGVNILLYGVPGTGKTELAKTLAKSLKLELYEVSYMDESDEAASTRERINAYKSAQALLKNRSVLLMYDEAEDIFDTQESFFSPKKQTGKAWINYMLENNPIPTIWITNDIDSVDPAIVRRFDMTMAVDVPKKKKRMQILDRYAKGLIERKILKKLAKNPYVSPAVMQRAIRVAEESKTEHFSKTVYTLIDKTLKAQRYQGLERLKNKKKKKEILPKNYDPALVNVESDLEKLAAGIAKTKNARLCFYGVPGTGKSAYGRYIAHALGRDVIVKKGSDLLSMWVGGTEQNIAAAFAEAKKKKAVLIFDEVDSFLQDRSKANANWEVSQVNEMLTQMESFEGVFIATTNLMENLDKASLRRFDMKLEFKALQQHQAQRLLESHCRELKIDYSHEAVAKHFHLQNLTPGDFEAVVRQHRFNPIEGLLDFVQRLEDEVKVKALDESKKRMGFV